ncbi:conjugal transfer nickase/helicase TraI [Klebsiella pneumoniae]|nr:conjugal transfer nickase/helicase TraI [Klebsiella pneumoniae]
MIHDAREKAGELGKEQVMVPVLNTANIRDGELRRLSTWENNPDALALVDSVYHRIAGISRDDGLITWRMRKVTRADFAPGGGG